MFKKYLLALFLLAAPVISEAGPYHYYLTADLTPYKHKLTGCYPFEGDRKGEFKGNPVAILDDASQWKVHPTQVEQFLKWQNGEIVHVEVRTSWYWFKREHQFTLCNEDRKENVYVMMINSASLASDASTPEYTTSRITNLGYIHYEDYRRNLLIKRGDTWYKYEIESSRNDSHFKNNSLAYIGYNIDKEGYIAFFIINGNEREAIWRWARFNHYRYW